MNIIFLLIGLIIGFSIAAPVGSIGVLLLRLSRRFLVREIRKDLLSRNGELMLDAC